MKRRILHVMITMLVLAILVPMLSSSVNAEEPSYVAQVGSIKYETIDEAVANWTNGSTLTLLADVTLSDVIKLKSTEHHILNLSTFTMTAASGKNAIEIVACGTGNAERSAITINADTVNPGGINAGSKSCIYYNYANGGITGDDRPIIKITGGVFTGSTSSGTAGIYFKGSATRKAATLNITGGTFHCAINGPTKSKLLISNGTFHYSVGSQGDSTAYRLISGGRFKSFGFMTADSNNTKFWIGTAKGTSNVGVYVDDEGYLVVGGPVITEPGSQFKASSTNYGGWNSYLKYSSAANNGLYYTSVEEALADNNKVTGAVTIYEEDLALAGSTFKGTLLLPADQTLDVTFSEGTVPTWRVGTEVEEKTAVYNETVSGGVVTRTYYLAWIPTANDFTYTAPSELTYDGNEKKATVAVKDGIAGMGEITVKYYENGTLVSGIPTDAGIYTVKIDTTQTTTYAAAEDLEIGTFTVEKAAQIAPAVSAEAETIAKKGDGKLIGVTDAMEYRKDGDSAYTHITGNTVENLIPGTYFVRYAENKNYTASDETEVTVTAGRKMKFTLPQNTVGYTVRTSAAEYDYLAAGIVVYFELHEGYSKTDGFKYMLNGEVVTLVDGTHYPLNNVTEDYVITVEGVADITAPTAAIEIENNKWTSFLNNVTFGLFFNETQDVTITAEDAGSGIDTLAYYLAGEELTEDQVKALTGWEIYNGSFKIDPNNSYVIYAKISDNAGNVTYINTNGMALDAVAPTLEGIENGKTYYGDLMVTKTEEYKSVTLDGEEMRFAEDTHSLISADNGEHTVVVTDYADNSTTYVIKVMKNYTVTFIADGKQIAAVTVGHGKDADIPAIPVKEGYTAAAPKWDHDGRNITADMEIHAVYTINKYTVTFKADGKVVKTETVEHGKNVALPVIPAKEGYTETAPKWEHDGKNITEDTQINAIYTKNEPGEFEIVVIEENVGNGNIVDEIDTLVEKIPLTEEEKQQIEYGEDVKIWVDIDDISDTVSADEKEMINQNLEDTVAVLYLDITVYKQVGDERPVEITELEKETVITLQLPDSLINQDASVVRTYSIVHVHDGETEIITPEYDAEKKTLTFMACSFSTYTITYTDTPVKDPTSPSTGEQSMAFLIVAMACSAVAMAVLINKYKKKGFAK